MLSQWQEAFDLECYFLAEQNRRAELDAESTLDKVQYLQCLLLSFCMMRIVSS